MSDLHSTLGEAVILYSAIIREMTKQGKDAGSRSQASSQRSCADELHVFARKLAADWLATIVRLLRKAAPWTDSDSA
jgi:hypothetical protein